MFHITPEERDNLFRDSIQTKLIVFSEKAYLLWDNTSLDFFESMVDSISTRSMTNMGDALQLAFREKTRSCYSWVIVMTDGESNRGAYRTVESFSSLVADECPLDTKIICLGYGDKFDSDVLYVCGDFVYVKDQENIPVVLGNIVSEIKSSVMFDLNLTIGKGTEDEWIVPEGEEEEEPSFIVGKHKLEVLKSETEYNFVYSGKTDKIYISYLYNHKLETIEITPIWENDYSEQLVVKYYQELTRKYSLLLYKYSQKRNKRKINSIIRQIKTVIENWPNSVLEYKEELKQIINNLDTEDGYLEVLNSGVGTGYTLPTVDSTLYSSYATAYTPTFN